MTSRMLWVESGAGDVVPECPGRRLVAERLEHLDQLAADQIVALRELAELTPGDQPGRDAAGDVEHAEGRHEGRQQQAGREQAVDAAGEQPGGEACRVPAGSGAQPMNFIRNAAVEPDERQDGADREIDVAIGHDIAHADGHQPDLGEGEEQVEAVVEPGPEVGPQPPAEQPQEHHEDHGRRFALGQPPAQAACAELGGGEVRAVGARRLDRDSADVDRRRLGAAQPGEQPREQLAADHPGLDQHGRQQDQAEEGRDGAGRQGGHRLDLHLLVADLERAGDRHALAQHLVDQHDQHRAQARAEHAAAAAQDRGAADDHGGDDDQLGAQAVLRGDALVLGDVHQAGERGAQRRQDEAADADERVSMPAYSAASALPPTA